MASHRKKHVDRCAYCEKHTTLTRDHVVPQCLFAGAVPNDLPVVYACETCNSAKKSAGDTFLRDVLVCDEAAFHHPVANRIFQRQFTRAVQRNQSALARYVSPRLRPVAAHTESGLFAGIRYSAPLPRGVVTQILSTMTRGLYLYYLRDRLPKDVEFEIQRIHNVRDSLPIVQAAVNLGALTYTAVGDSTIFNCVYGVESSIPALSMWFFAFYSSPVSQGVIYRITTRAATSKR